MIGTNAFFAATPAAPRQRPAPPASRRQAPSKGIPSKIAFWYKKVGQQLRRAVDDPGRHRTVASKQTTARTTLPRGCAPARTLGASRWPDADRHRGRVRQHVGVRARPSGQSAVAGGATDENGDGTPRTSTTRRTRSPARPSHARVRRAVQTVREPSSPTNTCSPT